MYPVDHQTSSIRRVDSTLKSHSASSPLPLSPSPSLPASLSETQPPVQSAFLTAVMAAEAAGRDDATVSPAECAEMKEWVRCLLGKFSVALFANIKKMV